MKLIRNSLPAHTYNPLTDTQFKYKFKYKYKKEYKCKYKKELPAHTSHLLTDTVTHVHVHMIRFTFA